jgi:hypothetical protein
MYLLLFTCNNTLLICQLLSEYLDLVLINFFDSFDISFSKLRRLYLKYLKLVMLLFFITVESFLQFLNQFFLMLMMSRVLSS